MKTIFLALLLITYSLSAAIITNKTTSPTGVTNIVKTFLTNNVIELGNTNKPLTTKIIIESGLSNNAVFLNGDVADLIIVGMSPFTGLPITYAQTAYTIENSNPLAVSTHFLTFLSGGPLELLTLATNKTVKISRDAVGVLVNTANTDFDLSSDYPTTIEPGHLVFTNLSANRFVFFVNATNQVGMRFCIKNISAANSIILTNIFGQKFDGASSFTLTNQFQSATVYSDGTNWLFESRIP